MAIAEQFAGLQMDQLIGAPLSAAADASTQLANSTADFINRVGFDDQGNVRNAAFGYQKYTPNEDGTSSLDEMKISVPILAIVPIPNLQIDEVNILFDMEVKQSERQESSKDLSASLTGSAKIGPVKVSVTGSVSSHSSNTRSSDNSAKYHVDVRATNHGTPEGLARVLDMMAANVAPALVGSSIKDGNGQELPEQARAKAERLKELRAEIGQIEDRLSAAQEGLAGSLTQLKKVAGTQLNVYREFATRYMNSIDPEKSSSEEDKATAEATLEKCSGYMDEVNQAWGNFQNQAGDYVKMIADSGKSQEGVSELFNLKSLKIEKNGTGENAPDGITGVQAYTNSKQETQYAAMLTAQNKAVEDQKNVSSIEDELIAKRGEYNDAISGKKQSAQITEKTKDEQQQQSSDGNS